ncbi:MAG TPA: ADP-glyceromanno-heptose 6-epimerase [Candidatus Didemnitutus sp.]|nr:ADP-glyceromanno-heptose 6-epimerase [Candidatus Didemnitutus sp.]
MTRIVVTGAAGFIGSRLLEALTRTHPASELLSVDHPITAPKQRNLAAAPGVAFADHQEFLRQLEAGKISPEIILHLGACSSTVEQNWSYLEENNLRYSIRLWEWCARERRRLIYASSAATYGDGSLGFDDEAEIRKLKPLNLYGQSKQDFDLWIEAQAAGGRTGPVQCVGLKFFNVFGPAESHKGRMASMVYHGWNQVRETGAVRLFRSHRPDYADGGQLRDFIYVRDTVDVMLKLVRQPVVNGLFNLGTGRAHSFRELMEALFAALGLPPRIEYIPMPEDLREKYQYFTEAKMRKLQRAGVSYSPTALADAVKDYVGWLRSNSA